MFLYAADLNMQDFVLWSLSLCVLARWVPV